jgi:SRSO17 transposase
MEHDVDGSRTRRFAAYLADLASVLGDGRRVGPLMSYCTGLLLPAERKSVEPPAFDWGPR